MRELPFVIEVTPDIGEGYFDGANVGKPLPFSVRVEKRNVPFRTLRAWRGTVIAGQNPYLRQKCYLRERLSNTSLEDDHSAAVARILDEKSSEIFSGICFTRILS